MTSKNPYRSVGTGGVYVEREADIRLRRELSDNRRFPIICAPAESGKTSLIRHTIDSLDSAVFCALTVDLSRLRPGPAAQVMGDLLSAIAKEGDFDQREIVPDSPEDTILAWLGTFPQRLLLFLDGCEALHRAEICEATFGKLRLLFNIRNENEEFARLQVFLAGAVPGRRLIPVHLQAPFGVGAEIHLRPFNAEQVEALVWNLSSPTVTVASDVGSRLTHHSGGLPFLCQQVLSSLWDETASTSTIDIADVDRAVEDLIERAPQIEHFAHIFRTFGGDLDLLDAFHRLCRGQAVSQELLASLVMTGLCEEDLPYRSSIYERVFAIGGPLALPLPSPVGQRPTRPVAIIAGPPPAVREDSEAIEVDPDEDSGFQVLSEPPPPTKPQKPVSEARSEAEAQQGAVEPVVEATAQIADPSPPTAIAEAKSAETPHFAADSTAKPVLQSSSTPQYQAAIGPTQAPIPSERTPTYAAQLAQSPPQSASTPRYPGPGSLPAVETTDAQDRASSKTPMYNLSMMPPVPSQRTPSYPMPGLSTPSVRPDSQPPVIRHTESIDEWPTKLQGQPARSETQELRDQIDTKILLSAELDLFCSTHFPHIAKLFNSPLSRAEKTDLLLAHVERSLLRERLQQWSSRRQAERDEPLPDNSADVISSLPVAAPFQTSTKTDKPSAEADAAEASAKRAPESPVQPLATEVSGSSEAEKSPAVELATGFKPPQAATMQVGIGLVLANRYFLTSEIGQGVAATMWNAYDRIKDEQVALKILHGAAAENPQLVERFWRSAQQMSSLSHPTIVSVLNKPREENGVHYAVCEFQPGGNFRQWVQAGKITRVQLMRTLQRLSAALSYAHDKKVFHRDIKPTNILFDSAGHARLTDFAMVWPADAAQKTECRNDRTAYMAPEEQAGGQVGDARADVYSLGMCALYALLGKELTPSMVMDRAGLIEQLDAPPPLRAVLLRAVAPNPNDRFASIADFSRALEFDAPALPGMVQRASVPNIPSVLSRTNPGLVAPGMRQSAPQMPVMSPLSRTNPPINPSLTRTNPGLFGGAAPPLTSPAKPTGLRSTGPQPVAAMRTTNPPGGLRNTNPPMPGVTRTLPPPTAIQTPLVEEDLQPPLGRSPSALAEYAIDTERVRAVTQEAMTARNPDLVMQPMPLPPPQRQWPLMLGFGTLVLVGGVALGTLLVNTTRKNGPVVTDPSGPANGVVVGKDVPITSGKSAPVQPVDDGENRFVATPIIPVKPGETTQPKTKHDGKAHLALGPGKTGTKADVDPGKHHDAKTTATGKNPMPEASEKPAVRPALLKGAAAKGELQAKSLETKPLLAKPDAAKGLAGKSAIPTPAQGAMLGASKPEMANGLPQKKTEPAKPALVKNEPAKPALAKMMPVKFAAKPVPRIAPYKPPVASAQPSAEAQAALRDAQQVFVRGERAKALAMALAVTRRGGEDAASAWRFVGGAACSTRQAAMATTAYRALKTPDSRRTLVDLCQRNGVPFAGGQFVTD